MPDTPTSHVGTILTMATSAFTVLLGFGASQWLEYQKEKRAQRHNETTRREARRIKRDERQHTTLVSLQDALETLLIKFHQYLQLNNGGLDSVTAASTTEMNAAVADVRAARVTVSRFCSRVLEVRIRQDAERLQSAIRRELKKDTAELRWEDFQTIANDGRELLLRIGERIRELDLAE